jgi:ankyrin repeat protein
MRTAQIYVLTVGVLVLSGAAFAADATASDRFYDAIRRDDAAAVQALIKSAGVNVKDSRGATPLMYTAAVGSESMMRRLLEAGADVNAKTSFDATALMWCADSLPLAKLLVEHGADVNARSKKGHTPVQLAASQAGGLPIVKLLLDKGASLKIPPDSVGMTPLAAAATTNDTALIQFLLDKGGPEILGGPAGPMAIMSAAAYGNAAIVKRLLAAHVDVNSQSPPETERVKNGPIGIGSLTPLILAAGGGDSETVRLLLDAGADVNAKDVRGMTPLMLAVATDHPNHDIIKMLLARHPDTKVKSKAGETALDWALKFKQPSIVAAVRAASPGLDAAARLDPGVPALAGAADARTAAGKAVVLLQKAALTNFKEGGCISCHAGDASAVTIAAARRKGVRVDESAAAEIVRAVRLQYVSAADGLLERTDPPVAIILSQALNALAAEGAQPDRTIDAMVHNLAAQQLANGSWEYRGLLRPPTSDSMFSSAAVAIRVFKQFAPPARKREFDERIAKAASALAAAEPVTTEDSVMQLMGLACAGADPAKLQRLQKGVIALQRAEGGWAQTPQLPPDAYATGTALNALHEAGLAADAPAYRKGVAFLVKTQAADGSWHVASRAPKFQPYFDGGFPYEHDQWISQWATAYATTALVQSLPDSRASAR